LFGDVQPLFGPVPGTVESLLMLILGVVAVVFQALVAYRWIQALRRTPAAFREGFRDVSGDDVRAFWKYVLPVVAAELVVVAVVWPAAVTPASQAVFLAVVLFFTTLAFVGLLSVGYLAVRRFVEGYRGEQR
jgi:uncharacterized membrane protein